MNNPISNSKISRRSFLTTAGGFTFVIAAGAFVPALKDKGINNGDISIWVSINPNGQIRIFNPSSEMGQGSMTALAIIIAEEMDVDWNDVTIEPSPVEPSQYGLQWGGNLGGPMMTVGSRTVKGYYKALRQAGAQARYVMRHSAARKWNVPIHEVITKPSLLIHRNSSKKITYAQISESINIPEQIPNELSLKDPKEFRLIGNKVDRFDIPSKTTGQAIYSTDVYLPDMVFGVIQRSPVHNGSPSLLNKEAILKMSGVIDILLLDYGVGIIAQSTEDALKAKSELNINWGQSKASEYNSVEAYQNYSTLAKSDKRGGEINSQGDINEAFRKADKIIQAEYKNDYNYHAQMEPLNAVISVSPDGKHAEAWVGSQAPDNARSAIARTLNLEFKNVTLHPCYLGGGFGRRSMSDYAVEAAILGNHIRKPLKLIWTREDDMQYGAFRPICLQHMEAALDTNGTITGWKHIIAGTGDGLLGSGAGIRYYDIPNQQIEVRNIDHGVRTKHWRSVAHGPNKYAIEAFIDEIATSKDQDPYQFRRKLMRNSPRELAVLDKVAEMSEWDQPSPDDRAKGMAFAERSGALTAAVAEISLNREAGKIKVHQFWLAIDAGVVVQPDNAIAQLEGGINFGLSSVLYESITLKDGKVEQSNFHNYPLLRISDAPESIECYIIPSQEKPEGIGEASTPIVGGAVANAFLALTGKSLRHMPFTPDKVKSELG